MKKIGIYIVIMLFVISICVFGGRIVVKYVYNNKDDGSVDVENRKSNDIRNIDIDSEYGNEIISLIHISNLYSEDFFKEVENHGLTDKAKIMFTFAKMMKGEIYSSYIMHSDEYVGDYIKKADLEMVANKLFLETDNLYHQDIFMPNSYDSKKENYINIPTGFVDFNYVKEIPYKIEQKNDDITVYTYRLYITCNTKSVEDDDMIPTHIIYYDLNKKNYAISVSDEKMDNENTQDEYLKNLINLGELSKEKLSQGIYKIVRKENSICIENISQS